MKRYMGNYEVEGYLKISYIKRIDREMTTLIDFPSEWFQFSVKTLANHLLDFIFCMFAMMNFFG